MLVSIATWITCEVNFREVYRARQHIFDESSYLSPQNCSHWAPESARTWELGHKGTLQPARRKCPGSFRSETPKFARGGKGFTKSMQTLLNLKDKISPKQRIILSFKAEFRLVLRAMIKTEGMELEEMMLKKRVGKDDKFWQVCYRNLNSFRVFM